MGGFVEVDVDVGDDLAEHGDVATGVVGVPVLGGESYHVTDELSGVNRKATEVVDEIVHGPGAVFVVTEDPGFITLRVCQSP